LKPARLAQTCATARRRRVAQGLVALTVQLEQSLPKLTAQMPQPRLLTSPYREPLCRFLAR
jgi:hypothetical protein